MNRAGHQRSQDVSRGGRSLIRRAVLGIVLVELACMMALAGLSVMHERKARLRSMSVMLEGRADSLFGAIQDAEDEGDSVHLDPREINIPRGDFYAVYDANGRQIGASEVAPTELLRLRSTAGSSSVTEHAGRHSYRVLQRGYLRIVDRGESATSGLPRPVTIVYATELDRIWREVFEAIEFYLGVSLALMLGTTVVLVTYLRHVLRPIAALASAAAAVSPRNLAFQAPPEAMAVQELNPLAVTLTTMIDELRLTFDRQHRFLGDAAHELKTAISVVRSSLQLMLLRPRSVESYEQGLQSAVSDNERAEELIARMLLMARLEEPRSPHSVGADPEQVVRTCVEKLWPLIEQAQVRVEVSWPVPASLRSSGGQQSTVAPRLVSASPEDLGILFSNLLVNAVEHSKPSTLVVLRAHTEETGVWVTLVDQGEGIPVEAQQHIFERFFRADQSRARVTGGAGLGLSIAKAIVDGAGGTIGLKSTLGEGTEVCVFLPFILPAGDRSPEPAHSQDVAFR